MKTKTSTKAEAPPAPIGETERDNIVDDFDAVDEEDNVKSGDPAQAPPAPVQTPSDEEDDDDFNDIDDDDDEGYF